MGRRSDHSRAELEALILDAGHGLMAEVGFARFSARAVAKRIGYSIGTVHNVAGSVDRLIHAINTRTFALWADDLRARLAAAGEDRIAALVEGYFAFARANTHLWLAIYDHRLPDGMVMPEADAAVRARLTDIVVAEVARTLGRGIDEPVAALARSLIATVHGHCAFELNGRFALMGETRPAAAALARVQASLAMFDR